MSKEPIPRADLEEMIKNMMEGSGVFTGEGAPPDLSGVTIDLSQMHLLDHSWLACTGYGGRRRHTQLWWTFHAAPALRAKTLCKMGRHDWLDQYKMREGVAMARRKECSCCHKTTREIPL